MTNHLRDGYIGRNLYKIIIILILYTYRNLRPIKINFRRFQADVNIRMLKLYYKGEKNSKL